MASRPIRVLRWFGLHALRAMWVSLMVLTPLFGFWLASSLAAYENASQWLALLVGLLLFPLLPVGWDLVYVWRRSKQPAPRKAILTRLDRLVLRTLLVNGVFLAGMMWRAPATSFRALAVRGDWILDGHDGPIATRMRHVLLGIADHFERRWHKASSEYGTSDRPPDDVGDSTGDTGTTPEPVHDITKPRSPDGWPMPAEADLQVTGMPDSVQTSPEAVGKYLAERITDQRRLIKALHDYVVLRMTYDDATANLTGDDRYTKRPSQQANDVFAARTAVCEGYARLFVALANGAGIEAKYITGYIRDAERRVDATASDDAVRASLEGNSHAWNAVKLDGKWLLVDTTWDDPTGGEPTLQSTHLFTPPQLFRYDHLPEEPAWQLMPDPISAGEFARQPLLSPEIGELGVVLEEPTRSQITVDGEATLVLDNPYHAELAVDAKHSGEARDARGTPCKVEPADGTKVRVTCSLGSGEYELRMFGGLPGSRQYDYIGTVLANSR